MAVVVAPDWNYLMNDRKSVAGMPEELSKEMSMAADVSPQRIVPILLAVVIGLLLVGTITLWVHYGTAVFFETIRTGFIACFG